MKRRGMKVRRMSAAATGLAVVASIALTGTGAASAATPGRTAAAVSAATAALKLTPGSWTILIKDGQCEVDTVASNGTWTSDLNGDEGYWAGGGSNLALSWTAGDEKGLLFVGKYVSSPVSYKGSLGGPSFGGKAKLVKGVVSSWDGFTC